VASLELTNDDLTRLAKQLAPLLAAELGDAAVGTADNDDRWLRTPEAARHLGMSVSELHRRAAAGAIPHEQEGPGAALYFKRSDLDAWRRGERSR
jgi:predicted DNA-binding transcriptional regulator AlpA